jgi:hypothetical protein
VADLSFTVRLSLADAVNGWDVADLSFTVRPSLADAVNGCGVHVSFSYNRQITFVYTGNQTISQFLCIRSCNPTKHLLLDMVLLNMCPLGQDKLCKLHLATKHTLSQRLSFDYQRGTPVASVHVIRQCSCRALNFGVDKWLVVKNRRD